MKILKTLLVSVILIACTTALSAQSSWSNWTTTDCFKGIDFRVKRAQSKTSSGKYQWDVQFRNRYNNKVTFSYEMVPYNQKNNITGNGRTSNYKSLKANSTESVYSCGYKFLNESSQVYVFVNKMVFGQDRYNSNYANCDR